MLPFLKKERKKEKVIGIYTVALLTTIIIICTLFVCRNSVSREQFSELKYKMEETLEDRDKLRGKISVLQEKLARSEVETNTDNGINHKFFHYIILSHLSPHKYHFKKNFFFGGELDFKAKFEEFSKFNQEQYNFRLEAQIRSLQSQVRTTLLLFYQ